MLKISYAGCLGLSLAVSAQFTLKMYSAARNHENSRKPLIWGFKVVNLVSCHQCLL